ncbi:MAG: hypothetical protein C4K48_03655 [Candidatus Thorarchaeota archaeon]|nr:MAG: hypothetical protein C4K48_03655 [Candidatus Thorarchaeota archaeon]
MSISFSTSLFPKHYPDKLLEVRCLLLYPFESREIRADLLVFALLVYYLRLGLCQQQSNTTDTIMRMPKKKTVTGPPGRASATAGLLMAKAAMSRPNERRQ